MCIYNIYSPILLSKRKPPSPNTLVLLLFSLPEETELQNVATASGRETACGLFKELMVSGFTFRPLIHFELFLCVL